LFRYEAATEGRDRFMSLIRLIIIIFLFYLIYRVLRSFQTRPGQGRDDPFLRRKPQELEKGGVEELIQDPHCGVFFPRSQGVSASVDGRVLYFHNKECRDQYLQDRRGPNTGGTR
jgi:hypothetical protein